MIEVIRILLVILYADLDGAGKEPKHHIAIRSEVRRRQEVHPPSACADLLILLVGKRTIRYISESRFDIELLQLRHDIADSSSLTDAPLVFVATEHKVVHVLRGGSVYLSVTLRHLQIEVAVILACRPTHEGADSTQDVVRTTAFQFV